MHKIKRKSGHTQIPFKTNKNTPMQTLSHCYILGSITTELYEKRKHGCFYYCSLFFWGGFKHRGNILATKISVFSSIISETRVSSNIIATAAVSSAPKCQFLTVVALKDSFAFVTFSREGGGGGDAICQRSAKYTINTAVVVGPLTVVH